MQFFTQKMFKSTKGLMKKKCYTSMIEIEKINFFYVI